jgi:hypothetical protein
MQWDFIHERNQPVQWMDAWSKESKKYRNYISIGRGYIGTLDIQPLAERMGKNQDRVIESKEKIIGSCRDLTIS